MLPMGRSLFLRDRMGAGRPHGEASLEAAICRVGAGLAMNLRSLSCRLTRSCELPRSGAGPAMNLLSLSCRLTRYRLSCKVSIDVCMRFFGYHYRI